MDNIYYNELGQLHRDDGPALITTDGSEYWYLHGSRHRIGGPAFIRNHVVAYYDNGQLHRLDGPAVEYTDGRIEYWIKNIRYSELEYFTKRGVSN